MTTYNFRSNNKELVKLLYDFIDIFGKEDDDSFRDFCATIESILTAEKFPQTYERASFIDKIQALCDVKKMRWSPERAGLNLPCGLLVSLDIAKCALISDILTLIKDRSDKEITCRERFYLDDFVAFLLKTDAEFCGWLSDND